MTSEVVLRDVQESDLPTFFEQQLDPEAIRMAAFPARDHEAFLAHWAKIMKDRTVNLQTVLFAGRVAGNIGSWTQSGERLVGYWFGREFWGKGIASAALSQFLGQVKIRPLVAHVAKHNIASIRVLQKCGFHIAGEDKFPGADGEFGEIYFLTLGADGGSDRGAGVSPAEPPRRRDACTTEEPPTFLVI